MLCVMSSMQEIIRILCAAVNSLRFLGTDSQTIYTKEPRMISEMATPNGMIHTERWAIGERDRERERERGAVLVHLLLLFLCVLEWGGQVTGARPGQALW